MTILTVNTGSSSIRLSLFAERGNELEKTADSLYKLDEGTSDELLNSFIQHHKIKDISLLSHRVVHGGMKLVDSCLINEEVEREIDRLSFLAPLHNTIALKWIKTCRTVLGTEVPQVAVFDTAFYASLPEIAKIYALPKELCHQHSIFRYGFHGLAHRAMLQQWQELRPDLERGGRVISLQLGSGSSMTAVRHGIPVDTSMGFSPLEGMVMATRPGDIDPGVLLYLQKVAGLSVHELEELLNKTSGLLGVSGASDDMRVLLESEHPDARLAVNLYCYRVRKYIGAYLAALGGVDAILFGGGVGENASIVREKILENMQWCGIVLDTKANIATIGKGGFINSLDSKVEVRVILVDEATLLAEEARAAVK